MAFPKSKVLAIDSVIHSHIRWNGDVQINLCEYLSSSMSNLTHNYFQTNDQFQHTFFFFSFL